MQRTLTTVARDYYKILGVTREASIQEIKRAYRQRAKELHPDINPSPEAAEQFKEVTAVYEVLSDSEKRRLVDLGGDPLSSGASANSGFTGFSGGLGDVFDAFFGGGAGGQQGPRSRVQPGNDALLRIKIDLAECATGVTKKVTVDTAVVCPECDGSGANGDSKPIQCPICHGQGSVQTVQRSLLGNVLTSRECSRCHGTGEIIVDPCHTCGGDGRIRVNRTVDVRIPAGVANGMRIRLSGEGEVGPGGGSAGDLYVEIIEREHPIFTRDGDDLHCTVEISAADAALGTDIELDTLTDGSTTVHIAPGTQPTESVRLRAQGIPRLRSQSRGDLYVHVDVVVPRSIGSDERALLTQLRDIQKLSPRVLTTDHGQPRDGLFSRIRNVFSGQG